MLDTGEKFRDVAAFNKAQGTCAVTGVRWGGNSAAAQQAEHDVKTFVTRVLHP
jgi:hypothetical protein